MAARDRIYFLDRNGGAMVLKFSDTYEVLATNRLDDIFDASPAIAGNAIYLRGRKYLYKIMEE